MPKVRGRTILPSTQEELEVLQSLGVQELRAPRKTNPYQVARHLRRAARPHPDIEFLRRLVQPSNRTARDARLLEHPTTSKGDVEVAAE